MKKISNRIKVAIVALIAEIIGFIALAISAFSCIYDAGLTISFTIYYQGIIIMALYLSRLCSEERHGKDKKEHTAGEL